MPDATISRRCSTGTYSECVLTVIYMHTEITQISALSLSNSQTSCTVFFYIYAGSPSVTSVTFNAQSNSFTCISSGGSARTVTWRRNGVVIPRNDAQQTQRVMNTTTSTYQSVLTIDTSMNQNAILGTFSCTVQNARGTSSRMVVVTGEI